MKSFVEELVVIAVKQRVNQLFLALGVTTCILTFSLALDESLDWLIRRIWGLIGLQIWTGVGLQPPWGLAEGEWRCLLRTTSARRT